VGRDVVDGLVDGVGGNGDDVLEEGELVKDGAEGGREESEVGKGVAVLGKDLVDESGKLAICKTEARSRRVIP